MIFSRILGRRGATPPSVDRDDVRSAARTHVGRVRKVNEDRVLDLPARNLWAVADGMGGHHAGDVAAQIAVDALNDLAALGRRIGVDEVIAALQGANAAIRQRFASADRSSGTTVVAALLDDDRLDILWAGDSRAYRSRNGHLELLTRDHSLVQEMVDAGTLASSAAAGHPNANVITRALGVGSDLVIDRLTTSVRPGDHILLCSDGVSRTLGDSLAPQARIDTLAQSVLDDALARDGSDNASVVLIAIR